MNEHKIFYFPYGNFSDGQAPLLKAAALYFDKLYILDPEKANSGFIGAGQVIEDVKLLEGEGILERITPEDVIHKYEEHIAEAVRADLQDLEFVQMCEFSGRAEYWTVALAKIPKEIREDPQFKPLDRSMQHLMGDVARNLESTMPRYTEGYAETWSGSVYDEIRGSDNREIEYRYADYPLPLGESIMMNHALFAGMLYSDATPLTDDPFHSQILSRKLKRALDTPEIREILEDRRKKRQLASDIVAAQALTDTQLDLSVLSPDLSLEDILEYRHDNKDSLAQTRDKLGRLARRIKEEPWTQDFYEEVEHTTIPDIAVELDEAKKMRDAWLKTQRGKHALKVAGIGVAAASIIVPLVMATAPLLPVGIATAALGIAGGMAIPGLEWIGDWREDKSKAEENGLHYLLSLKRG